MSAPSHQRGRAPVNTVVHPVGSLVRLRRRRWPTGMVRGLPDEARPNHQLVKWTGFGWAWEPVRELLDVSADPGRIGTAGGGYDPLGLATAAKAELARRERGWVDNRTYEVPTEGEPGI